MNFVYEIDVAGQPGEDVLTDFCGLRMQCRGWHTLLRGALSEGLEPPTF